MLLSIVRYLKLLVNDCHGQIKALAAWKILKKSSYYVYVVNDNSNVCVVALEEWDLKIEDGRHGIKF
jgi:hypothetical protein